MRYLYSIYTVAALLSVACSSAPQSEAPKISSLRKTVTLERSYNPVSDSADALENRMTSFTGYLFNGEKLVEVFEEMSTSGEALSLALQFEAGEDTYLYFVANSLRVGELLPGALSRSDFLHLKVEPQEQLIPSYLVLSGGMEILPEGDARPMKMSRGMARLDMKIKHAAIYVKKFTVMQTQVEQFLFPASAEASAITYTNFSHTFDTPLNAEQLAVGYINEQQNNKLRVLVEYNYNGVDGQITIPMPSEINRNFAYQIALDLPDLSIPDHIVGSVDVVDWGEGTGDVATPETNGKLKILVEESTLPAVSELDVANRILHLSRLGGEVVLAFDGEYNKRFELMTSDDRVTVTSIDSPFRVAKLAIKATQVDQGEAYSIRIKVYKEYLLSDPGVEVRIDVDANRMPVVRMGGLIWMAYNGVGNDQSLYPPLEFKQTIRDVYATRWKEYARMMVWGPRPKPVPFLYPWEYVRTTQPEGSALTWPQVMQWVLEGEQSPCPTGWRLPTYAEIGRIWPANGSALNATYKINGVTYKSFRMASEASDLLADDKKTVIKLQLFVIQQGNNELVFPLVGWRRRDDYAGRQLLVAADVGQAVYLWTQDKGPQNWSAKVVGVLTEGKSFQSSADVHQTMTEAYHTVRCVKDEE